MSQLLTIEDNKSPQKSGPRRRYFREPLPAHRARRGHRAGTRWRAVATTTRTSAALTFAVRACGRRTTDTSVDLQPDLRCVLSYIFCLFAY